MSRGASTALRAWLREHARPFAIDRGPSASRLQPLNSLLADARVTLLGESAPDARETVLLRLALLRYLAARGATLLGMPCTPARALRLQQGLMDAVPADSGRAARPAQDWLHAHDAAERLFIERLVGGRGSRAPHLRDQIAVFGTGLRSTWLPAPGSAQDNADRLAALAEAHDLLDLQLAGTNAAGNPARRIDDLRRLLAPPAGESLVAAAERLDWALDWMDMQFAPLTDALGSSGYAALRNLMQWSREWAAGTASDEITEGQLAHVLAERWPAARAVVYGHCADLVRDDAHARKTPLPAATFPATTCPATTFPATTRPAPAAAVRSAGDFIARTLLPGTATARRTASIWCLHGGGLRNRNASGRPRAQVRQKLPPGSLNARLAVLGEAFVLPLHALDDPRAAPLREPQLVVTADGTAIEIRLQAQVDLICFLPEANDCA